jgi:hypothetical protein
MREASAVRLVAPAAVRRRAAGDGTAASEGAVGERRLGKGGAGEEQAPRIPGRGEREGAPRRERRGARGGAVRRGSPLRAR